MHVPDRLRLQARRGARDRRDRGTGGGAAADPRGAGRAAWEGSLRALIAAPALQERGNPLAIELALRATGIAGGGALRLMARLMRPGARGGWVNGSLTWNELDWQVHRG